MLFPASVSDFSPGNKDCIQYRCSGFWHRHVSGSSISCRERQYCRNKKSFSCQRSVCSLSFWKCCGKSDSRLHTVPHSRKAVKKSSDCFLSCGSRILEEQRHLPESRIFRKCFGAGIDLLITDIHPAIGFCAVVALANLSTGNEMQGFQRAAFVDKGIQCLVGRRCKGDHNGKSVTLIEDDLCI